MPYRWAILLLVCIGLGILYQATDRFHAFTSEGARRFQVLQSPVELQPTPLIDMHSNDLLLSDLKGKPLLVDFIYTDCPWVCYAMGSTLEQVRTRLIQEGYEDEFNILSISFDPDNDRPPELKSYAERFNASGSVWNAAVPIKEQDLTTLLKAFGIIVIPGPNGELEHNAAIHFVNAEGKLAAILDIDDVEGIISTVVAAL